MTPEPPADDLDADLGQPWQLKVLHLTDDRPAVEIGADGVSIGRSDTNDVVLPSGEFPSVSGTHARVVVRDGEVWVEDLGSKNGTYVAGEPIQRRRLHHGDVLELGRGGPRFVVLGPSDASQTVMVPEHLSRPKREMGAETVELVREKLGIPAHTKVTDVVKGENRRNTYLLVAVLLLLIGGGIYGAMELQSASGGLAELRDKIDKQLHAATDRLDRYRDDWEQRLASMQDKYQRAKEESRRELEAERVRLTAELNSRGSREDLDRIARQLAETESKIKAFDPVKLEQVKQANVARVGGAVVLIEVAQTFVDSSNRKLYVDESGATGFDPNFRTKGELYELESTGSGFVISEQGWILTNAHVVLKKGAEDTLRLGKDVELKSVVDIKVVFTNTNKRIPAILKDWVSEGSRDLALLKIEPFAGMPCIPGIDTRRPRPAQTKPVYALGFPLGKRALQPDDKVIASAFRGIVSRGVSDFLQIDAAVHPGNSGGPVITEDGEVIGVVVGMQRINSREAAPDMGYIIPIDLAGEIWPYREDRRKVAGK